MKNKPVPKRKTGVFGTSKIAEAKHKRVRVILLCALALAVVGIVLALVLLPKDDAQTQPEPPAPVQDAPAPSQQQGFEPFTSQKLKDAHESNNDVVGWLTLGGCEIDNMVFQSADNDYYLRKNDAGEYDVWGCYFLDYINPASSRDVLSRVSIIYGYSLDDYPDEQKFSKLKRFKQADFCKANPTIGFSLLYEQLEFEIFAACDIPISIDYIDPEPDDAKYRETLDYMLQNSYYDFGVEVGSTDKILVLSTCTSDENVRYVVAGKLK